PYGRLALPPLQRLRSPAPPSSSRRACEGSVLARLRLERIAPLPAVPFSVDQPWQARPPWQPPSPSAQAPFRWCQPWRRRMGAQPPLEVGPPLPRPPEESRERSSGAPLHHPGSARSP